MKTLLYITLFFVLLLVPIMSNLAFSQEAGFDREMCLQNCSLLKAWNNHGGQNPIFDNCVSGCETKFWRGWDRNTEIFKDKLQEPD